MTIYSYRVTVPSPAAHLVASWVNVRWILLEKQRAFSVYIGLLLFSLIVWVMFVGTLVVVLVPLFWMWTRLVSALVGTVWGARVVIAMNCPVSGSSSVSTLLILPLVTTSSRKMNPRFGKWLWRSRMAVCTLRVPRSLLNRKVGERCSSLNWFG